MRRKEKDSERDRLRDVRKKTDLYLELDYTRSKRQIEKYEDSCEIEKEREKERVKERERN